MYSKITPKDVLNYRYDGPLESGPITTILMIASLVIVVVMALAFMVAIILLLLDVDVKESIISGSAAIAVTLWFLTSGHIISLEERKKRLKFYLYHECSLSTLNQILDAMRDEAHLHRKNWGHPLYHVTLSATYRHIGY